MYSITDLKKDTVIQIDGIPYKVTDYQHTQLGRGGAVVKTKLRNLLDGGIISKTFKGNEKVEPTRLLKSDMQYLYRDGQKIQLMANDTYEQYELQADRLGNKVDFIVEGQPVVALIYRGQVVDIELARKISIKVKSTEPGVKGDTANAALKPAVLESGLKLQVPLFIKNADLVEVDTSTGRYLNRA